MEQVKIPSESIKKKPSIVIPPIQIELVNDDETPKSSYLITPEIERQRRQRRLTLIEYS